MKQFQSAPQALDPAWHQRSLVEEVRTPAGDRGNDAGDEGGAPQTDMQAVQEVLSTCGRQVAGSLSDVAGLQQIKQLLREVFFAPNRFPEILLFTNKQFSV